MIRQRPLALTATIAFSVVAAGFGLATPQRAEAAAPPTVDPVIEWNRTVLQLIRTPGVQPATVHPTRNLAMMFGSIRGAAGRAVVVYQFLGSRAGGGTQSDLRRATHARRARGRRRTGPQCRALRAPPPFLKAARASRALNPPPSSSRAKERMPPLASPPCGGHAIPDARGQDGSHE